MKILQLCKKFPYPLKDGESIAVTYLSKALNDLGHEVTLLSMNTSKHYTDVDALPDAYDHYVDIHCTYIDNSVNIKDALLNLFSKESYHVSRFVSQAFEDKLVELLTLETYDVIQLETLYLAPYVSLIKQHSEAVVAMRSHNVEFEIWERIAKNTTFLPKKWYLQHLTNKLKQYELDHLNDYDYLIAVSDRDLAKFKKLGYRNGAMASPIGLDIKNYVKVDRRGAKATLKVGFIGALDWVPNVEGLEWFLSEVWPTVMGEGKDIEFHVAGRHTPDTILAIDSPGVFIHGEVPNAVDFMNGNDIMVVPLFSGSGMRVKILEGMALAKMIITTSLGKEGIHVSHGEQIMIADDASTFAETILGMAEDRDAIRTIGEQAYTFVKENYDHKVIAAQLVQKYQSLIDHPYEPTGILSTGSKSIEK